MAAGACDFIIVTTNDTVFTATGGKSEDRAGIPVVVIKAKEAAVLLAFGKSSFLYSLKRQDTEKVQMLFDSFSISSGNVRGSGHDAGGAFIISGTESNGHVTFEKRYDSACISAVVTAIFRSLDTHSNGEISLKEFKPWMQGEWKGLSDENAKKLFNLFNTDCTNMISEAEFLEKCSDRLHVFPSLSRLMPQSYAGKKDTMRNLHSSDVGARQQRRRVSPRPQRCQLDSTAASHQSA